MDEPSNSILPRLHVEYGPPAYQDKSFDLANPECIIGRSPQTDIHINEPRISRRHAQIIFHHDTCFLSDLQSGNGTFLNGQKLESGSYKLKNGDLIQLGAVIVLRFEETATITGDGGDSPILLKGLWLDVAQREVYINGMKLKRLAKNRFKLLQILVEHQGAVVSKEQIADTIWPDAADDVNPDQALFTLVFNLRQEIAQYDAAHEYIITIPGVGLKFTQRVT